MTRSRNLFCIQWRMPDLTENSDMELFDRYTSGRLWTGWKKTVCKLIPLVFTESIYCHVKFMVKTKIMLEVGTYNAGSTPVLTLMWFSKLFSWIKEVRSFFFFWNYHFGSSQVCNSTSLSIFAMQYKLYFWRRAFTE